MSNSRRGEKNHMYGIRGDKASNWKGGISTYTRKLYLNSCYRALRVGAQGSYDEGDWEMLKAQYNWTCPCCHLAEPKVKLSADHIIPLCRGGSNNIENIQPLCRSCNSKKHTKIIKFIC